MVARKLASLMLLVVMPQHTSSTRGADGAAWQPAPTPTVADGLGSLRCGYPRTCFEPRAARVAAALRQGRRVAAGAPRMCAKELSSAAAAPKRVPAREDIERDLADLLASGAVQLWRRELAPPEALAGGARGAGHNANSSSEHVEPAEIYVVGTSHISLESAADVERVIRAVQPENVVVELCRSRAGMMYADVPPPTPGTNSKKSHLQLPYIVNILGL
jgi:hypothetical protein